MIFMILGLIISITGAYIGMNICKTSIGGWWAGVITTILISILQKFVS